jgi:LysR family glycine cleavage system transcriptional activator
MDGAGVVLGWRHMSREHLAAGRVVEPFDLVLSLGNSFYLAYPEAHSQRQNIAALRDWLLQEVREDQEGSGRISDGNSNENWSRTSPFTD